MARPDPHGYWRQHVANPEMPSGKGEDAAKQGGDARPEGSADIAIDDVAADVR